MVGLKLWQDSYNAPIAMCASTNRLNVAKVSSCGNGLAHDCDILEALSSKLKAAQK